MKTAFKYGKQELTINIPDKNLLGILEPSGLDPIKDLDKEVRTLLEQPTAGPSLSKLIRMIKPRKVAVIVNDLTRSTPTPELLPPVIEKLLGQGISREQIDIIIATGTHRPMDREEITSITGENIFREFNVINHDCDSPDLVTMGILSGENELRINRIVAEADIRIAIGEVLLHYYAGFAGGRKSILPGVAGRETIMKNHHMMTFPGVGIGKTSGNPVSEQMVEAVEKYCPLHFIVNCVSNSHKQVVTLVAGDAVKAWEKGIEVFRKMNFAPVEKKADVVFVSAGGFPKDINMYQAHKALEMCSAAVKEGGSIVFFAELAEGYGHPVFQEWAERQMEPYEAVQTFEKNFRFGAHKIYYLAKLAQKCDIYLYSSVAGIDSRKMYCHKLDSLEEILPLIIRKYGSSFSSWVIPQGGIVLPVYNS